MNQHAASNRKVLIMAGGTGGHIYPALTIARDLRAAGASVEWLGTRQGLEARVIGRDSDIPLHYISIGGLRGKGLGRLLIAPFSVTRAVAQAIGVIRRSKPGCVLGMGGFVTGPGGLAARLLGTPLLIHEQNAIAGLSNLLLAPLARVVMEAFPGAFRRKHGGAGLLARLCKPTRIKVVGNPVRSDILALPPASERFAARSGPLRLLVLGGSLGATAINAAVPALLAALPLEQRPLVRHQCGEKHLAATLDAYRAAGVAVSGAVQVLPYIEDMAAAYGWADLVLCRAGASTIAELAAAGLPAILVPYPWAVDDHQRANAALLVDNGAAWLVPQPELSAAALQTLLAEAGNDRSALLQRARAAEAVALRDASSHAASLCLEACNG